MQPSGTENDNAGASISPWDGTERRQRARPLPGHWRFLRLLNFFRVIAAVTLLGIHLATGAGGPFGQWNPTLFLWTVIAYLAFGVVSGIGILRRHPGVELQSHIHVVVDVVAVLVLMFASGGLSSGLGALIVVPVAIGSLVLPSHSIFLISTLAALVVLAEPLRAVFTGSPNVEGYTQGGVLGAIFLSAAIIGTRLARRVQESEALAAKRALDLRNLSELNDYIIHHLQTGIVVIDPAGRVQLMNSTASHFLGVSGPFRGRPLTEIAPRLDGMLDAFKTDPHHRQPSFRSADDHTAVVPHFTRLGAAEDPGTLVFLEDTSQIAHRIQKMKLAALGRLTASIAHELRNPLGAMDHAAQLMREIEGLREEDARLTEIISDQVERINNIVEAILKLSRREEVRPYPLDLTEWLPGFIREYAGNRRIPETNIALVVPPDPLKARVDPGHLQQIMHNLADNALEHGKTDEAGHLFEIRAGVTRKDRRPYLEVRDWGDGISQDEADHIFEPFYTASPKGTGLGLFIARELCDLNRARLNYVPQSDGACFRIVFADPERWIS